MTVVFPDHTHLIFAKTELLIFICVLKLPNADAANKKCFIILLHKHAHVATGISLTAY